MFRRTRREFVQRVSAAAGSSLLFGSSPANAADHVSDQIHLSRSVPVAQAYDLVVCGGGPSGCAAALAARRQGLTVLLIEIQGQLGGMNIPRQSGTSAAPTAFRGQHRPSGRVGCQNRSFCVTG
jgi:hypothetical protein